MVLWHYFLSIDLLNETNLCVLSMFKTFFFEIFHVCFSLLSMAIRIMDRVFRKKPCLFVVFQGFPTQKRYLCHHAVGQPSCYAGNGRLKMAPVPMVWERKEAKACRSSTNRCVATGLIIKEIHFWEPCHRPTSSRTIVRRWSMTMWIDLKTHTVHLHTSRGKSFMAKIVQTTLRWQHVLAHRFRKASTPLSVQTQWACSDSVRILASIDS